MFRPHRVETARFCSLASAPLRRALVLSGGRCAAWAGCWECTPLNTRNAEQGAALRLLVADSETPEQREQRKRSAGKSAGESYAATLRQMVPGCEVQIIEPADSRTPALSPEQLARFDGIFVSGSPLHVYCDTAEV